MIERQLAVEIRDRGVNAIDLIWGILRLDQGQCTAEEYQQIKRGIGLSVGRIQTELLDPLYVDYPDLDDLK